MKKYSFIFCCFFLAFKAKGQFMVSAPDVTASIADQIAATAASNKSLFKSQEKLGDITKALEETKEYLNKVSAVVRKVQYIKKARALISRAKAARDRTNWLLNKVGDQISKKSLSGFLSYSISLLDNLNENLSLIEDIFKGREARMSDFERFTYLDKKLEKMELKTQEIEYEEHDLAHIAATQRVLNRIK